MNRSTKVFIVSVLLWEIFLGFIYGFLLRYNQAAFTTMNSVNYQYYFSDDSQSFKMYQANTTQIPFPMIVIAIAIILLLVGFALVSGYAERCSITNASLTFLIFALTAQNFFVFRDFWDRAAANDPDGQKNFTTKEYQKINFINFGNDIKTGYTYTSSSWFDAIGASLAMYAGFSAVMGCVGLGQIFFLSFFGTFFYELNSAILWRLFIPDNGFPSRAFAYGGALGLVSSLISPYRAYTVNNSNFVSTYSLRTFAFLGIILVWCTYPILVTVDVYNSTKSYIIAMSGQVNMWIALAGSAIGCFIASMYVHRKFCVHDMVFASITGGIAYSSGTVFNYNPGAALAIGTMVGLLSALAQTKLKRVINRNGVIDANGAIFQFLMPSLFAAIFSAVLAGIGQSAATASLIFNNVPGNTDTFTEFKKSSRSFTNQGGYQMAGWAISISFGVIAGLLVGLCYWLLCDREQPKQFFSDFQLFSPPDQAYVDDDKQPVKVNDSRQQVKN